ncbi:MAG: sigma-70 family RNA polymerase sigma factor [Acidobacteria bacterium]|nr:sigma-70 family RNA polymerase sigma factor [Acidobacteriota bacterium]
MAELTSAFPTASIEQTENVLLVKLRERDEQAFEEVFFLYKELVYNLAFKLLKDKAEALDVTQEVFLTLHRTIHRFRGECKLKTWIYRVTINHA